jgi:hypothetical protein
MARDREAIGRLKRAAALTAAVLGALWLLRALGLTQLAWSALVVVLILATWFYPPWGTRLLDRIGHAWRAWIWRDEEGRHHAFGGVSLHIEDDGRHLWLAAVDLQRVLRSDEPDDAFAARHSERWRRDGQGRLWLRLDAVVERLRSMPGRDEPRTQKLRRYLERDVVYPAQRRRRRAS